MSQQPVHHNGMWWSRVLGILWLWWLENILALIFGYIAKNQVDRSGGRESGRGMRSPVSCSAG
ncbi:MAG: DUF4190 domain-containing protein [Actinomycetota bacterium]